MALIIEDGSIIPEANTFVDDQQFGIYTKQRGITVPDTEEAREALLILAMDYLRSREAELQGDRVLSNQPLIYPRIGVEIMGVEIAPTEIPAQLQYAQMEAAIAQQQVDLLVTESAQNIQSEQLDVLSVSYFSGGARGVARLDRVDMWLDLLIEQPPATGRLVRV